MIMVSIFIWLSKDARLESQTKLSAYPNLRIIRIARFNMLVYRRTITTDLKF